MAAGDMLASRHDAVVVTVNHRLGVLGYLQLPDAYDGSQVSGVAGLLDLRQALEWVRDNIEGFGGDPANVTIVGHSGGGAKVACLLAMPSAHGLFHRAIVQSATRALRSLELGDASQNTARLLSRCARDSRDPRALRAMSVAQLTDLGGDLSFRPVVGTAWLPEQPFSPSAPRLSADIPMLIGTTADEAATFKFDSDPEFPRLDDAGLRERLARHPAMRVGDNSAEVLEAFRHACPQATCTELLVLIATAKVHEHAVMMAERMSRLGHAPVFKYLFDYKVPMPASSPFAGRLMAAHSFELPFVFDIADRTPIAGTRRDRDEVASRMASCWVSFARTGTIDPDVLGQWAEYNVLRRRQMIISACPHLGDDSAGSFYHENAEVVRALRTANDSSLA